MPKEIKEAKEKKDQARPVSEKEKEFQEKRKALDQAVLQIEKQFGKGRS